LPVYQYACTECGEQLEVRQSFTDASLTECPACEGRLRKVLNAVGVVFKGSGFYRNDSRADAKAATSSARNGESTSTVDGPSKKESATGSADGGSAAKGPAEKTSSTKPASGGASGGAKPAPAAAR
jgi:putative FmdB family regulatory protein